MTVNPRLYPLLATIGIFVVAYIVCWLQFPYMLSTRVAGNLLTDNAYLGIVAVGMTLVILSGGIDLSVGSVIAFSGVFIAVMLRDTGLHPLLVFALLLAVTTAFGAAMGAVIHGLAMPAFIVTLAGMFLARGASYMLTIESVPIAHPFYDLLKDAYWLMPGKGRLTLTGKLGDVMQESAQAAMSYVRSKADEFGLPKDFHRRTDVHVHVPEGAIPKDGPSAGITLATALVSNLARVPTRRDVAMTGEITLRGKVLPIGGVKEKVLAAHRAGLKTIILPKDNEKDLADIPKAVLDVLELHLVESMDEVLTIALAEPLAGLVSSDSTETETTATSDGSVTH